jgi:transposase InsO family protein
VKRQQTLTARDEQELALCKHITRIYTSRRMVYGSRKVHQTLRADGVRIGRNRVRRIMREQGLYGIRKPRAFKNRAGASASTLLPNVLNRQFIATKPNEKWLTDFTHIRISGGLDIYLAVVLDTFSRKVVGWAVSPKRAGVALRAIQAAYTARKPAAGLLLHSDRGTDYTSQELHLFATQCGMKQSFSRIGNCWDNAPAESFFRHCKAELRSFQSVTYLDAYRRIAEYIETFYNRERVHSAINYRTPEACENDWQRT